MKIISIEVLKIALVSLKADVITSFKPNLFINSSYQIDAWEGFF